MAACGKTPAAIFLRNAKLFRIFISVKNILRKEVEMISEKYPPKK